METSTSQSRTFFSINGNAKLAKKATENTPNAVKSVYDAGTPNEKTVWQIEYSTIKGYITDLFYQSHPQYGDSLNIVIDNEGVIKLKVGSRYYYSFVKALPNIDLKQKLRFAPWKKEVDGKTKQALFVHYGDDKDAVKLAYTKENPNGMPEMKQVTFKGKTEWDDTDMQVFCKALVENQIIPKLKGATSSQPSSSPANSAAPTANTAQQTTGNSNYQNTNDADDLPF